MNDSSTLIEVAVALPVDRSLTYAVPASLAAYATIGKRVLAPLGRRRVTGYVLGPGDPDGRYRIKRILDVLDEVPLFPPEMIPFFRWVADYYMHPIGEVIKCALPGGLNVYDWVVLSVTEAGRQALSVHSPTPPEIDLLRHLKENGPCRMKDLPDGLQKRLPAAVVPVLEDRGWVVRRRELRGGITRTKTERFVALPEDAGPIEGLSEVRQKILQALADYGELSIPELKKQVPTAANLVRPMAEAGQVVLSEKPVYRDPFGEAIEPDTPRHLTGEQDQVVSTLLESLGKGFRAYLLAGVTGSGKTEVYLQSARAVLERGLPILVLVPEIALISQMERRFRARFGERVAVLHSGLSDGERFDQWVRILQGEAPVVIGARSAVFAPLPVFGMIIVDEEHDTSYKQGSDLLYNGRDLAVVRAKLSGSTVLLGSATPSIQSYYNVRSQKFTELTLSRRVEKRPLPEITLVDLRKHRETGARRFITPTLEAAMRQVLGRGEQVLIFLNRRGFASFPVCAACGESIRCNHCDITLTFHRTADAYRCHYCGFTRAAATGCTVCGSARIKLLGIGTEKVEGAVNALFPEARVTRMDRDTTTRKGSVLKILRGLQNRAIDVLVGTQMVAKGHDFPDITLVGIICADLSLSFPDFRAGERTFQLLAQVAGRAGRGDVPGRVILQTYAPDHFSIVAARSQDFKTFYKTEIGFRRALVYPPFSRLIQMRISGKDRDKTQETALAIGALCRRIREAEFKKTVEVMGPIEASIGRIADRFRWQLLLKGSRVKPLHRFVRRVSTENPGLFSNARVRVVIDVDPFFMS